MFNLEENTRKEFTTISAYIGIIAFAITIASYFLKAFQAKKIGVGIIWGSFLLIAGYSLLMIGEIVILRQHKEKGAEHYGEGGSDDKERDRKYDLEDIGVTRFGYVFLIIFFGLVHFYPQLTFHVRYYDKFAAIGAFFRAVSNLRYVSLIGVVSLLIYYVLGTIPKFTEKGIVNKLQLVSRAMLVVYYGITVALLG